jgi:hypothetical protein
MRSTRSSIASVSGHWIGRRKLKCVAASSGAIVSFIHTSPRPENHARRVSST